MSMTSKFPRSLAAHWLKEAKVPELVEEFVDGYLVDTLDCQENKDLDCKGAALPIEEYLHRFATKKRGAKIEINEEKKVEEPRGCSCNKVEAEIPYERKNSEAFCNLLSQAHSTDVDLTKPRYVLVYDCGTGKTQRIVWKFSPMDESYDKMQEYECDQEGKFEPGSFISLLEGADREAKLAKWIKSIEADRDAVVNTLKNSNETVAKVIVFTTSWHRTASAEVWRMANRMFSHLHRTGATVKNLQPPEEALFEAVGVAWEMDHNKLYSLDPNRPITGSIACGGGSTQVLSGFQGDIGFHTMELGCIAGIAIFREHGTEGLAKWSSVCSEKATNLLVGSMKSIKLSGTVVGITLLWHSAFSVFSPARKGPKAFSQKRQLVPGKKNSENNYTATEDPTSALTVKDIVKAFDEKIELDRGILSNPQAADERDLKALSCLVLVRELLATLVEPDALVVFRWGLTWSFGWFIQEVLSARAEPEWFAQGHYPTLRRVFSCLYNHQQAATAVLQHQGLLKERAGVKWFDSNAAAAAKVASELGKDVVSRMLETASQVEAIVTPVLSRVAASWGGRLEGLKSRLKTRDSLSDKLFRRLQQLLNLHNNIATYVPHIDQVTHEVDDVLRYTIVVPFKTYKAFASSFAENFSRALKDENTGLELFNGEEGDVPNPKLYSYWAQDAIYMGVNGFVAVKLPDDRHFTFELQFHTPDSFAMKSFVSHQLYEQYRNRFSSFECRCKAHIALLRKWKAVDIPEGIPVGPDLPYNVDDDKRTRWFFTSIKAIFPESENIRKLGDKVKKATLEILSSKPTSTDSTMEPKVLLGPRDCSQVMQWCGSACWSLLRPLHSEDNVFYEAATLGPQVAPSDSRGAAPPKLGWVFGPMSLLLLLKYCWMANDVAPACALAGREAGGDQCILAKHEDDAHRLPWKLVLFPLSHASPALPEDLKKFAHSLLPLKRERGPDGRKGSGEAWKEVADEELWEVFHRPIGFSLQAAVGQLPLKGLEWDLFFTKATKVRDLDGFSIISWPLVNGNGQCKCSLHP